MERILSEAKDLINSTMNIKYIGYILTNKHNKVLYTGQTDNIGRRMLEHQTKLYNGFTKRYYADKLVYYEEHNIESDAIAREKQIKGWIRQKKLDLINSFNPGWVDLTNIVFQKETD
ncbi:MAG: excinuclease ABC subunit C [Chlorobi bacterium OLB5]|nr:MAG: excinuclease ABC subunit C [Chlorobi bacterium OLB5]